MRRSLIAVALLLVTPLCAAQVYKWTDTSGTVHYSEAPPAQGIKYSKVTTTGTVEPLAKPAERASPEDAEGGSSESSAAPKTMADTPEIRKSLCASLQSNLRPCRAVGPW